MVAVAKSRYWGGLVSMAWWQRGCGGSTFLEEASSALSSSVLATMTRAVRGDVVARLRRDETGAKALADANAHTRTPVRASWDEAENIAMRRDQRDLELGWKLAD